MEHWGIPVGTWSENAKSVILHVDSATGELSMKRVMAVALFLVLYALLPASAHANTITIAVGQISFDTFIPATPLVPGTAAFNLINFTGSSPVTNSVLFNNASFLLTPASGVPLSVSLGSVGPGALLDPSGNPLFGLQFANTTIFSSATFSATLSQSTFLLSNGVTATLIGSPIISGIILPSSGTSLTPGADFAVLTVTASVPNTVIPEPGTLVLLGTGLAAAWGSIRRKAKDS